MLALSRSNQGGERERTPDHLLTHPVTTSRISEATQRAEQLRASGGGAVAAGIGSSGNPLLPGNLSIQAGAGGDDGQFAWAQERLRALSADTPAQAIREYEQMRRSAPLDDAQQYGLAVAQIRAGKGPAAVDAGAALLARHPGNLWLQLGIAQAGAHGNDRAAADARFDALVARMPDNLAVARTYAAVLNGAARRKPAAAPQAILRPLLNDNAGDPGCRPSSPAPATWPATRSAPARPTPRPPTSTAGRNRPAAAQHPQEPARPGLLRPRPDRCPDRGDHPGGAGTAAPGHPRRGPAPAVSRGA